MEWTAGWHAPCGEGNELGPFVGRREACGMPVLAVSLVPVPVALLVAALGTPIVFCLFVAGGLSVAAGHPWSPDGRRRQR